MINHNALNLVGKLNEEWMKNLPEPLPGRIIVTPWDFHTNGDDCSITFMDHVVWCNNDGEEREILGQDGLGEDIYEPLEPFVRREAQEIVDLIAAVRWVEPEGTK